MLLILRRLLFHVGFVVSRKSTNEKTVGAILYTLQANGLAIDSKNEATIL